MDILLEAEKIPATGKVALKIDRAFEIKISASEAQHQVKRWLLNEVSYLLNAELPALVVKADRVVWRVPASLSMPGVGWVGLVGVVDVEVESGQMNNTPECKAGLEARAEKLGTQLPPHLPKNKPPLEYIPPHIPPASLLLLHEDTPPTLVTAK